MYNLTMSYGNSFIDSINLTNGNNPYSSGTANVHYAGLGVDRGLHLRLHVCKVIHSSLESSDPFHRVLSLVSLITEVPLQRSVPVRVPGRGGGSGLG
jgi:hypothetical protein